MRVAFGIALSMAMMGGMTCLAQAASLVGSPFLILGNDNERTQYYETQVYREGASGFIALYGTVNNKNNRARLYSQMFDANGAKTGSKVLLIENKRRDRDATLTLNPAGRVLLADGTTLIAAYSQDLSSRPHESFTGQIFLDGAPNGPPFSIASDLAIAAQGRLIALRNGRALAVWNEVTPEFAFILRARVISAGPTLSDVIELGKGVSTDVLASPYLDGFVLTISDTLHETKTSYSQIYDADGNKIGSEATWRSENHKPTKKFVFALEDETLLRLRTTRNYTVFGQKIDSNWAPLASETHIGGIRSDPRQFNFGGNSSIVGLAGGGLMTSWATSDENSNVSVKFASYSSDLSKVGPTVTIADGLRLSGLNQMVVLGNGDVLAVLRTYDRTLVGQIIRP